MDKLMYPSHQKTIDDKFEFIEKWLPKRYTSSVNIILKQESRDPAYIRQVKNMRINDSKVVEALYIVSVFNKIQVETEP